MSSSKVKIQFAGAGRGRGRRRAGARVAPLLLAATFVLFGQVSAFAACTIQLSYTTTGGFNGAAPSSPAAFKGLVYTGGSRTTQTTGSGFTGSGFGSVGLDASPQDYTGDTLTVHFNFSQPTGIVGGQTKTLTAVMSGGVNSALIGGVFLDFPASQTFNFSNAQASGTITLQLNDISLSPNSTLNLNGLVQINATINSCGAVTVGPAGAPAAVGPTGNNDDYTNRTLTGGVGATPGGLTTAAGAITFANTVRNDGTSTDVFTVTAPTVPAGFAVETSTNGGASFTSLNSGGSTTLTLAAGATGSLLTRVTAPAGIAVLTGYPTVIRVTSGNTTTVSNETIDRLWSGFISAVKTQAVTNGTGVGGPASPVPGAVVEYVLTYSNVTPAPQGSGNVDLTATNVVFTEDGAAAPNNWAGTTDQVVGSASDSRGGVITGDALGSSLLTDTVVTLLPGQSGTFRFRRRIR